MAGSRIYSFTAFGAVAAKWRFVRAGVEGGGLAWCMPTAGAVRREVAMGRGREQWRGIVALGLVLGVSGCAAPGRQAEDVEAAEESGGQEEAAEPMGGAVEGPEAQPMVAWQQELAELDQALGEDEAGFGEALSSGDCDLAYELRDRICELAERICGIAEEHPEAAARCDDADVRCSRARERVADECD